MKEENVKFDVAWIIEDNQGDAIVEGSVVVSERTSEDAVSATINTVRMKYPQHKHLPVRICGLQRIIP